MAGSMVSPQVPSVRLAQTAGRPLPCPRSRHQWTAAGPHGAHARPNATALNYAHAPIPGQHLAENSARVPRRSTVTKPGLAAWAVCKGEDGGTSREGGLVYYSILHFVLQSPIPGVDRLPL